MKRVDTPLHQQILAKFHETSAGLTDEEISELVGVPRISAGARRNELVAAGVLVNSGTTRQTRHGRPSKVWVLADDGGPITTHQTGAIVVLRSGDRVQTCQSCGALIPPGFPDGAVVYEKAGAFTDTRPSGFTFHSCRRIRRRAAAR